ncbi:MAG TPA: single-stranded DNA-binding protein [bacterium]|mgnify:CR=1 FL=1|nr:single-stranded DNA-binding protein [bacterium]HOG43621.1 single-stranded DNA-binding protein [bacterium]
MSSFNSLNKVLLLGRLGRDPEKKYTGSGTAVCNFSVATSESVKKGTGYEEKTEWHKIIVFGNQAENVSKFVKKGSLVFIEGRIQSRSYQDKDGNEKYVTEIVANTIRFLDIKESADSERVYHNKETKNEQPSQPSENTAGIAEEDDLPF